MVMLNVHVCKQYAITLVTWLHNPFLFSSAHLGCEIIMSLGEHQSIMPFTIKQLGRSYSVGDIVFPQKNNVGMNNHAG